jgi:hypothetical protein
VSQAEVPAQTDAEQIKQMVRAVAEQITDIENRLGEHANGINSIGANMQWLVDNVKGLFQMFSSPQFLSQISTVMMGQMSNATGPAESADAGSAEGTNAGGSDG